MKKDKSKGDINPTGETDVLNTDTPQENSKTPEVEETKNQGASVIKRGVEMEAITSPRLGVPGQATATRQAVGGGLPHPSAQVGRSPSNPNVRGAGTDPMNKIDIRDEFEWNEVGALQYRTLIEGSPAGFEDAKVLGNYSFKDNPLFQFDNTGTRPGVLDKPYRRRIASISKDQLFFIAGQHDSVAKNAMQFYPISTYSTSAARQVVTVDPAIRGNYLIRGMQVNIVRGEDSALRIASVAFDSVSLPCASTPTDLDVRQDNARVYWDVNDKAITETLFDLVNKPENLGQNKYSPIPDGQPDAIQHLLLAEDIANLDGAIAFMAMRSMAEAYAYNRMMRTSYGAGDGSRAQARAMLAPRLVDNSSGYETWADNVDQQAGDGDYSTRVGLHKSGMVRLSMPEYIMTFLDSPTKYNNGFGVWLTQPRGLRLLFEEAQKAFDSAGFMIDKDTYQYMDAYIGWKTSKNRLIGVCHSGIISPVDPNQIYVVDSVTGVPTIGPNDRLVGKYTMVDYVLNGSMYNQTQLRSPLIDAILEVVKYRMFPKLSGDEYQLYIPFDFSCEHMSFGQAVILEAIPYVHQFNHNARAVFERFESQYGVNPLMNDLFQPLTLNDVYKSSMYKGIGADGVPVAASPSLELAFAEPENYNVAAALWDGGLTDIKPNGVVGITFSDFAPISDSADEPRKMLFPMMYPGMTLEQLDQIVSLGAEKVLCSRDMPIHRYALSDSQSKFSRVEGDTDTSVATSANMPFFEFQRPQEYASTNVTGTKLSLSIYDILCAPRMNGRIAPAPKGMLDFVACNSVSPKASKAFKLKDNGGTLKYGWKASPGASLVFTEASSDDVISFAYANKVLSYTGFDIDDYRVSIIFADTSDITTLGSELKRYFVHVNGGCLTYTALQDLVSQYNVYLSPNQSMQNETIAAIQIDAESSTFTLADDAHKDVSTSWTEVTVEGDETIYTLDPESGDSYIGAAANYPTITVTDGGIHQWRITNGTGDSLEFTIFKDGKQVRFGYTNPTLIMWTMDNLYPFVHSPFQGVAYKDIAEGETYEENNLDVGLLAMFGMAGYQGLWYDRRCLDIYAQKQEAGGRIFDNKFLHESNILFS